MRKSLLMTAAAAMGLALGGGAHAQDAGDEAPGPGIGQEVRDTARSQDKTDDVKGIGQEVRDIARAQHELGDADDGTGDDDPVEEPLASNQGIGEEARELAQDPAREGGIGQEVSDLARDRGDNAEPEEGSAPEPE